MMRDSGACVRTTLWPDLLTRLSRSGPDLLFCFLKNLLSESTILEIEFSPLLLTPVNSGSALQLLDRDPIVCIDANVRRNLHCFFGDVQRAQIRVFHQGSRRRRGVAAARSDGRDRLIGVDHVS